MKWISIKERLPEVGQECLCCRKFDHGWWFGCDRYADYGFSFVMLDDPHPVQFWMPLPPPPAEAEQRQCPTFCLMDSSDLCSHPNCQCDGLTAAERQLTGVVPDTRHEKGCVGRYGADVQDCTCPGRNSDCFGPFTYFEKFAAELDMRHYTGYEYPEWDRRRYTEAGWAKMEWAREKHLRHIELGLQVDGCAECASAVERNGP